MALFGTGFGPVTGSPAIGRVFTGAYQTNNPVTVNIGGVTAEVLWAGLVGPGLYQINVRIPTTLADGDHIVVASSAGASTQNTGRVRVAASAKLPTVLARNGTTDFYPLQERAALDQLVSFVGLGRPTSSKRRCKVEPFTKELLASAAKSSHSPKSSWPAKDTSSNSPEISMLNV
jgi:hypothetical protein